MMESKVDDTHQLTAISCAYFSSAMCSQKFSRKPTEILHQYTLQLIESLMALSEMI